MAKEAFTPLLEKIVRLIDASGPMSLAEYMHLCMADREFGYYKTRDAIGAPSGTALGKGDFITAPEISQMFGELIGIWCIAAWQALDRPASFALVEAGPGRGTLMADALRAAKQVPDFCSAADIVLIESSDRLIRTQKEALLDFSEMERSLNWIDSFERVPDKPAIIIGNEFLDALPFRQFAKTAAGWQEVGIVTNDDGTCLKQGLMANSLGPDLLPPGAELEPEGSVFEIAPAREAFVEQVSTHLAANGGAALLIDYGHDKSGFGDTFQAVREHRYADPLATSGEADLTSHVDFDRLQKTAAAIDGIKAQVTTQEQFLLEMGLLERAGALGADRDEDIQNAIRNQVERLAGPQQMGQLFKVLAVAPEGIELPAFS